jgi:Acyl-CoA dehydrogenase, C-terminal domain
MRAGPILRRSGGCSYTPAGCQSAATCGYPPNWQAIAKDSAYGPLGGPPDRIQGVAKGSASGPLSGPPDRIQGVAKGSASGPLSGPPDRIQGAGQPGPEGSAQKLVFARLNQEISALELDLLGEESLRYEDWSMRRPAEVDFYGRPAGYRYLRAKGNSIEGGTSEILRNIVAERVLGLPSEPRVDKDVAWKDLPR